MKKNEQQKKRIKKQNEDGLRNIWDNIRHSNIHIIGIPEGEKRKGAKRISEEIISENFYNLQEETDIQV